MITFTGKLNGTNYNKIKIIVDEPEKITSYVNDIINPYRVVNNTLECYVIPSRHKEYYLEMAETHKDKHVNVIVSTKRYSFDGKKGTSLILKQLDIINM